MTFAELENLLKARKWYDFAESTKEMIKEGALTSKDASKVKGMMLSVLPRMHPHTSSSASVVLTQLLPRNEAVELLEKVERVISDNMFDDVGYANDLILVQLYLCVYRIENGEYSGRESEILGWFKIYDTEENEIPFSKENYTFLQYVAYALYKRIRNFDLAQKYLLRYITDSSDFSLLEELVELSIVSESFFNFSAVTLLDGFSNIKNEKLIELFVSFAQGNVSQVTNLKSRITALLDKIGYTQNMGDCLERIVEKTYLINILNVCFTSTTNAIPFDTFISELGLNDSTQLIPLLLKALGYGLVCGYVDSKHKCLFFNKVVPRTLSEKDLADMKDRFSIWKDKLSQVIKQIEINKFAV